MRCYPKRCKDAHEFWARLPQWEVLGCQLEEPRGRILEEDTNVCALDQLIPDESRQSLDAKFDLVTYQQRLQYAKAKLGIAQHRVMAQAVCNSPELPISMDLNPLGESPGGAPTRLHPRLRADRRLRRER